MIEEGEIKKSIRKLYHNDEAYIKGTGMVDEAEVFEILDEAAKDLWQKFRTEDPMEMSKALLKWFGEPKPMSYKNREETPPT